MTLAMTLSTEALGTLNQRALPLAAIVAVKIAVCLTKWATHRRTRHALSELEPWQLRDVGLTPEQAETEASRAFWDA